MTIGAAVTTRNRPDCLEVHLEQMLAYEPRGVSFDYVVVDDASDNVLAGQNRRLCEAAGCRYILQEDRRGVARSKNHCLRQLSACDYLFLFDDDAFPDAEGWWEPFVGATEETGCQHSMYMNQAHSLIASPTPYDEYSWGMGVCLFASRLLIDTIGGFDARFGLYGYEHFSFTERAEAAGMTAGYGKYLSPQAAEGKVFSLDYDFYAQGRQPSVRNVDFPFRASVVGQVRQGLTCEGRAFFDSGRATLFVPFGEQDEMDIVGEQCTAG